MRKLNKREKQVLSAGGAVLAILLLYLVVISPLVGHLGDLGRRIPRSKRDLRETVQRAERYRKYNASIRDIRERLRKRDKDFDPYSFLEQKARVNGITMKKITPSTNPVNEFYRENTYRITLEGITLNNLVKYLYDIENSKYLLTIKKLDIQPKKERRGTSNLLDVNFVVSTFVETKGGKG